MHAYLKWLQFLASVPGHIAAKFKESQTEVTPNGKRLIWHCPSDEAYELVEPLIEHIPGILAHGFQEFECFVAGERKAFICHKALTFFASRRR